MPKEVIRMATMTHKLTGDTIEHEVEKRLDDMGLNGERPHSPKLRDAAKAYYLELVQEHLANTEQVVFDDVVDDYEGDVLGFVAGYEACLKAHGPALR
jgi:hemerythrin-like domain-containing protein